MIILNEEDIIKKWNGDINKPLVSINCLAYNHEKYISQALDSFLSQKTCFPFEIIVHDDASTDQTANIIKEYEKKYSKIIKPIYEDENLYTKDKNILAKKVNNKLKGKYVAFCEGDDYWTDNTKLQKQFDSLEENNTCYMCVHITELINEDGTSLNKYYPKNKYKKGIIDSSTFIRSVFDYNFHTSSYFINKKKYIEYFNSKLEYKCAAPVGDLPMMLYFGSIGNVFYIDSLMSVYRQFSTSSWSMLTKKSNKAYVKNATAMINMAKSFNKFTSNKYCKECEKFIDEWQFGIYYRTKNYRKMLDPKYAERFNKIKGIRKIVVHIGYYFPSLAIFIEKINEKIKGYY